MEVFSVQWRPYNDEQNYSIGVLAYSQKWYFKYNRGVIDAAINQGFRLFPDLNDIEKEYVSEELFPTFSNRYLDKSINVMKQQLGQLETDKILIKHIK